MPRSSSSRSPACEIDERHHYSLDFVLGIVFVLHRESQHFVHPRLRLPVEQCRLDDSDDVLVPIFVVELANQLSHHSGIGSVDREVLAPDYVWLSRVRIGKACGKVRSFLRLGRWGFCISSNGALPNFGLTKNNGAVQGCTTPCLLIVSSFPNCRRQPRFTLLRGQSAFFLPISVADSS